MDWGIVFSPEILNFFRRAPLALVIDTRASLNLKIKYKRQNNSFAIILPPLRNFHVPQFNNPGFSYLSDTITAI